MCSSPNVAQYDLRIEEEAQVTMRPPSPSSRTQWRYSSCA